MNSDDVQSAVRQIIAQFLGYYPENNLILIFEDKENIPHIMSNAPNRQAVDDYLKSLLKVPHVTRTIEGATLQ